MLRDWQEPPELREAFEKLKNETNCRLGKAGREKGKHAEQRVLQAVHELTKSVTWMNSTRRSTSQEDTQSIDVVLETNIGMLFVQVKSSRTGARHFRRKRRRAHIVIVVIEPEMSDTKIRAKVHGALGFLRRNILENRRKTQSRKGARR